MSAADAREALEAAIRRQLTNITKRPHTANECTDAILAAADKYAADEVSAALDIQVRTRRESDRRDAIAGGRHE